MSHDIQAPTEPELGERMTGTHGRNRMTWLVAAAAVIMIAGVGAFGISQLTNDPPVVQAERTPSTTTPSSGRSTGSTDPAVTTLGAPSAGMEGRCALPTPALLASHDVAFGGTVTAIEGDTVTLSTTTVYVGDVAEQVQVTAPSAQLRALLAGVQFEVGGEYLVSASGGVVSMCDFSGPASPRLERRYERAFVR